MIHLLMGYSCETLGVYPFTPVDISLTHTTSRELLGTQEQDFDIMICPGVSTYVGGDITAGMYALDFDRREKPCVLVDLGTNGEMAIGCKDRIMVTSTAAGPAFEGGNIVCGTGSIPGAICKIELDGENVKLETIGNEEPRGICGAVSLGNTLLVLVTFRYWRFSPSIILVVYIILRISSENWK